MAIIIQSGSKQYVVDYGQQFAVDKLNHSEGDTITIPVVYAFGTHKGLKEVKAKIVSHIQAPKIRVVKYRPKSNYHRQYGYRHQHTILELQEV